MAWNRGPQPSHHAHTEMRWDPEGDPVKTRARCIGCGQQWKLMERRDKTGSPLWTWAVVVDGDSDPNGAW